MWLNIRTFLLNSVLTENTLTSIALVGGVNADKASHVASGIVNVKRYIETKDIQYIKLAIHELEQLI